MLVSEKLIPFILSIMLDALVSSFMAFLRSENLLFEAVFCAEESNLYWGFDLASFFPHESTLFAFFLSDIANSTCFAVPLNLAPPPAPPPPLPLPPLPPIISPPDDLLIMRFNPHHIPIKLFRALSIPQYLKWIKISYRFSASICKKLH